MRAATRDFIERLATVNNNGKAIEIRDHVDLLESTLMDIRNLIESQPNVDCLGVGYPTSPDICAPWPISAEVISNINSALRRK